jgi:hypothetical protein
MRGMHRVVLLVALVAIAPVLAGCEGFDSEKFDIFSLNEKKKLKGERKELFPEGVPGVTQGIPPEYLNRPPPRADPAVGSIAGDLARPRGTVAAAAAAAAAPAANDNAAAPAPPISPPRQPRQ